VGTAAAILTNFEVDRWNADVYGTMALASRLSSLVKNRAATLKLAYSLRGLNSALANFFKEIRKGIKRGTPKDSHITPERVLEASETLFKLHGLIGALYDVCRHDRLTNNTSIAGTLGSIKDYNDEILELAEVLRLSLKPEVIQAICDRANAERERGEVFDLSEV